MTGEPFFSVVIPTYNRVEILVRVLDALRDQTDPPPFEVIIINDGSRDDTVETVSEGISRGRWPYRCHFESQENAGPGRARNRGTSIAAGRYVVYIGDDTVPHEDFLRQHAAVHEASGGDSMLACLGYTGWPDDAEVTPFMEYINEAGEQFGYGLIEDGAIVPFNFFYTSNISVARETLGPEPFDTSFPAAAWEDIELAWRLERQGLRIRYNASARTSHYHPMAVDSFCRRQYKVGHSGAIFFEKHPELGGFLGVDDLHRDGLAGRTELSLLTVRAKLGERWRALARPAVFAKLLRQHYLRGLRDGLAELGAE